MGCILSPLAGVLHYLYAAANVYEVGIVVKVGKFWSFLCLPVFVHLIAVVYYNVDN